MTFFNYLITLVLLGFITFFSFFSASHLFFSRNIVYTILSLIAIFFLSSIFLFLLNFHFFSVIYVLVYIGAIAVFFLFILLLLDLREEDSWYSYYRETASFNYFSLICTGFFLFFWVYILNSSLHYLHWFKNQTTAQFDPFFSNFFLFDLWFTSGDLNLKEFEWVHLSFFANNDIFNIGYSLYTYFFFLLNLVGFVLFIAMFCSINLFLIKKVD